MNKLWGSRFASNFDIHSKKWVYGSLSDVMARVERYGVKVKLVTAVEGRDTIEIRAYPSRSAFRKFESVVYCIECRGELADCKSLNRAVLDVMES